MGTQQEGAGGPNDLPELDASRLLVLGVGRLGRAMLSAYPQAHGLNHDKFDITEPEGYSSVDWASYDAVINTAAYTNVDHAETDKGRAAAWRANARGCTLLASTALRHNLTLVYVSTDFVFEGQTAEHSEQEPFSPINVYGASKAAGELAVSVTDRHYIVRIASVIGDGPNFVRSMRQLALSDGSTPVVSDQIMRPTFAVDVAGCIGHLLEARPPSGTYNFSNTGPPIGYAKLAQEIFVRCGRRPEAIEPMPASQRFAGMSGMARRALNGTFDLTKIISTGLLPRDWREAFDEYWQVLEADNPN
jgi:dTDP-4-dehydrorhamnose reductase